jgi:hypothetical protein
MNQHTNNLRPTTAAALDALLAGWADRQALSPMQAEAIRQAIVPETVELVEPVELPFQWWEQFFSDLSATFRQSLRLELDPALGQVGA